MSEDEKQLIKRELYDAVTHFIERQKLVAQAMVDLGLDLEEVGRYGALAWAADLPSDYAMIQFGAEKVPEGHKLYNMRKRVEALQLPDKGVWKDRDGNEWEYYLHGMGCRLTNIRTGEPIDWECNVPALEVWFFLQYLEWQLNSPDWKDRLVHTRKWVQTKDLDSVWELIREIDEEHHVQPFVVHVIVSNTDE